MKYEHFCIDVSTWGYRLPYNNAIIELYNYPAYVTDGTIIGTKAVTVNGDTTGTTGQLVDLEGKYEFYYIGKGNYTAIISGTNITTEVMKGFERISILPSDITGTEIAYKDGSLISIANMIRFGLYADKPSDYLIYVATDSTAKVLWINDGTTEYSVNLS